MFNRDHHRDRDPGRHLLPSGEADQRPWTSSVAEFRAAKRRAARAIALGRPVGAPDRDAGLEYAKGQVVAARWGNLGSWALLLGVAVGAFRFDGPVRFALVAAVVVLAVANTFIFVVQRRARRWWHENRRGTRYENW